MKRILATFVALLFGAPASAGFVENMKSQMPEGMTLDEPLERTFNWLEQQGWENFYPTEFAKQYHTLNIYPPDVPEMLRSFVTFGAQGYAFTAHWSHPDAAVDARVYDIASTSGDGGRAAIWLDDNGKQWFVHLGHDVTGVITDDPVKFLQFLGIGYVEPGGLIETNLTLVEDAMAYHGIEDPALVTIENEVLMVPPLEFQTYLDKEFGVTTPNTARDLGIADFAYYDSPESTDPFVQWLIKVTPPPSEEDLAQAARFEEQMSQIDFDSYDLTDPDEIQRLADDMSKLDGPDGN